MSYMKDTVTPDNAPFTRLNRVTSDIIAAEKQAQREKIERLAWEAQRAVNDYLAAVKEYEKDLANDAGRRADAEIAAGKTPF